MFTSELNKLFFIEFLGLTGIIALVTYIINYNFVICYFTSHQICEFCIGLRLIYIYTIYITPVGLIILSQNSNLNNMINDLFVTSLLSVV